jgi:hypothetical protein
MYVNEKNDKHYYIENLEFRISNAINIKISKISRILENSYWILTGLIHRYPSLSSNFVIFMYLTTCTFPTISLGIIRNSFKAILLLFANS